MECTTVIIVSDNNKKKSVGKYLQVSPVLVSVNLYNFTVPRIEISTL